MPSPMTNASVGTSKCASSWLKIICCMVVPLRPPNSGSHVMRVKPGVELHALPRAGAGEVVGAADLHEVGARPGHGGGVLLEPVTALRAPRRPLPGVVEVHAREQSTTGPPPSHPAFSQLGLGLRDDVDADAFEIAVSIVAGAEADGAARAAASRLCCSDSSCARVVGVGRVHDELGERAALTEARTGAFGADGPQDGAHRLDLAGPRRSATAGASGHAVTWSDGTYCARRTSPGTALR